jgi:hypothetical protein
MKARMVMPGSWLFISMDGLAPPDCGFYLYFPLLLLWHGFKMNNAAKNNKEEMEFYKSSVDINPTQNTII